MYMGEGPSDFVSNVSPSGQVRRLSIAPAQPHGQSVWKNAQYAADTPFTLKQFTKGGPLIRMYHPKNRPLTVAKGGFNSGLGPAIQRFSTHVRSAANLSSHK
jgi:hypothetical protein